MATGKATFSEDEADIRALIEVPTKSIMTRMPPRSLHATRPARRYIISRRRSFTTASISRKSWPGSTHGTGLSIWSPATSITVSGDFAFAHGFYRMSGTPKAAGRPISFWMRETLGRHRVAGAWMIVHEHASVPFYMDGSLRPAFDLQP
jgi:hypothetical protein